jgi:hypothetical protein
LTTALVYPDYSSRAFHREVIARLEPPSDRRHLRDCVVARRGRNGLSGA